MNARKRQPLWDLLAYASRTQAPGDFCQKVTLRAESLRQHSAVFSWSIAAAAAAVLVVGIGSAILLRPFAPAPTADGSLQRHENLPGLESCAEEFEKVVLMDELLAVNDPTQLDDEAFAKLLFR